MHTCGLTHAHTHARGLTYSHRHTHAHMGTHTHARTWAHTRCVHHTSTSCKCPSLAGEPSAARLRGLFAWLGERSGEQGSHRPRGLRPAGVTGRGQKGPHGHRSGCPTPPAMTGLEEAERREAVRGGHAWGAAFPLSEGVWAEGAGGTLASDPIPRPDPQNSLHCHWVGRRRGLGWTGAGLRAARSPVLTAPGFGPSEPIPAPSTSPQVRREGWAQQDGAAGPSQQEQGGALRGDPGSGEGRAGGGDGESGWERGARRGGGSGQGWGVSFNSGRPFCMAGLCGSVYFRSSSKMKENNAQGAKGGFYHDSFCQEPCRLRAISKCLLELHVRDTHTYTHTCTHARVLTNTCSTHALMHANLYVPTCPLTCSHMCT